MVLVSSPIAFGKELREFSSFPLAFFAFARSDKNRSSLVDLHDRKLNLEEFSKIVSNLSSKIVRFLKTGDVVATVCGNSIDFLTFVLAAIDIGIVVVPINPACKKYEFSKYFKESGAVVVVHDHLSEHLQQAIEEHCTIKSIRLFEIMEGLGEDESDSQPAIVKKTDPAFIFFSSGTSGPPKAIVHSHQSLIAHLQMAISIQKDGKTFPTMSNSDTVFGVLPFFHMGGLMTVFLVLFQGATVIVNEKWDPVQYLQVISEEKVTVTNIVPPVLNFLATSPLIDQFDLSSLRQVFVGATNCEVSTIRKFQDRFPAVTVTQLFGMTEAGAILLMNKLNNNEEGSVGIPLPGVEIKLIEEEMFIRAATMMKGYLNDSNQPAKWFQSGDLAVLDNSGKIHIKGRAKDVFKVRGWQVNPHELEEAIKHLPGVIDCVVIGIKDDDSGSKPKAFIVGDANTDAVLQFVKGNFISYKHLHSCERLDELPRNASGKIRRRELENRQNLE